MLLSSELGSLIAVGFGSLIAVEGQGFSASRVISMLLAE